MAGYVDADWHTCHRKLQAQFKKRGGWCHQSAARAVTNGSTAERHTASLWLSAVSYLTFFPPCRFLVLVSREDAILHPQQNGGGCYICNSASHAMPSPNLSVRVKWSLGD